MSALARHAKVEHLDDERDLGHGYIITLHYGWTFASPWHEGVRGFDTIKEATQAVRWAEACDCTECKENSK